MEGSSNFPIDLTDKEKEIVKPFFSNVDKHVFALINLPEVIKGTLFSRYSRSDKSARRLLLDEFIANKDVMQIMEGNMPTKGLEANLAVSKAEDFYQRVLVGYGDDSVAELAGGHLACENISSIAGDLLTDSRIGVSPLEKSARYIPFDKKVNGMYLWYRDPKIMNSKFSGVYSETMDMIFDLYTKWIPIVMTYIRQANPRTEDTTERAYENATRAKACDVLKNMLPAGRLTNVGLFANGRAFEYLLVKLYSSELSEGRELGAQIHTELQKTMPAFVKRAQQSEYLTETRDNMNAFVKQNIKTGSPSSTEPYVKLVDYDKDAETKVLAGMLYYYTNAPVEKLRAVVDSMSAEKKKELIASYLSKRRNRKDKPGRALENTFYTFELCANFGIFRDLHRHRVLTLDRQKLTTNFGYDVPKELEYVNLDGEYRKLMDHIDKVYKQIAAEMPIEAQYIVPRSFHMMWYMKLNLREVYHLTELRSGKQGHPDYRKIAQNMKKEVEKVHPLLTEFMQVDMNEYALPRIESEKRIDQKLAALDKKIAEKENKQ
ncbi:MAG: FAD-dependent thymidylate synthase [Candidatus Micrarchaeales archaeon]